MRSWPRDWDDLSDVLDAGEALLVECVKRRDLIISKIANAELAVARKLAARCAVSHSALIGAVYPSLRHEMDEHDLTAMDIVEFVVGGELWEDCAGASYYLKPKKNGGQRLLFTFSDSARAVQRLAHCAVKNANDFHPRQFLLNGGVRSAATWISRCMRSKRTIATTDFPNFFLTVNRKRLDEDLPLPGPFVSKVLYQPMDQALNESKEAHEELQHMKHIVCQGGASPQRGIPPGNALSSISAEVALTPALHAVEGSGHGVIGATFADNIAVSGSNDESVGAAVDSLISFAKHRFGSDLVGALLSRKTVYEPGEAAIWIGRSFELHKGEVVQRIADPQRLSDFEDIVRWDIDTAPAYQREAIREKLIQRVKGWRSAHSFDPHAVKLASKLLTKVLKSKAL